MLLLSGPETSLLLQTQGSRPPAPSSPDPGPGPNPSSLDPGVQLPQPLLPRPGGPGQPSSLQTLAPDLTLPLPWGSKPPVPPPQTWGSRPPSPPDPGGPGPQPLLPGPRGPEPPGPSPLRPRGPGPSPSLLRPGGPVPQPFLAQTQACLLGFNTTQSVPWWHSGWASACPRWDAGVPSCPSRSRLLPGTNPRVRHTPEPVPPIEAQAPRAGALQPELPPEEEPRSTAARESPRDSSQDLHSL